MARSNPSILPLLHAPEVNLRNSTQARKRASEKSTLALKPRTDVTRSPKQGYQWPHEKDLCPQKKKGKETRWKQTKGEKLFICNIFSLGARDLEYNKVNYH